MKDFLARHPMLVGGIAIGSIVLTIIMGLLLLGARDLQLETLHRYDRPVVGEDNLPGPKGEVSTRSKRQLDVVLRETPHVLGGWIVKLDYGKTDNPVLHSWFVNDTLKEALARYEQNQLEGRGFSSAELNRMSEQSVRNSEETKSGIIKCGSILTTNLPKISPEVVNHVSGVCRATIPPFDDNVNIAVVVAVDMKATENSPEIQAVRRSLLRLQIDIFNRDFQGRETWARQLGER